MVGETAEKNTAQFPEVETVVTKTGGQRLPKTDGSEQNDLLIMLKHKKYWQVKTKEELIAKMEKELSRIRA